MTKSDQRRGDESMLYVVSYDIPDDRRRTRVHSALTGFGTWVQYSVFECFLDRKQRVLLEARLLKEIHQRQHTVVIKLRTLPRRIEQMLQRSSQLLANISAFVYSNLQGCIVTHLPALLPDASQSRTWHRSVSLARHRPSHVERLL